MNQPSWIDRVRDMPVADVATRLGYEVRRGPSSSSCKCPACGTERRHRKTRDRRGSVGMPHGGGWRCFTCDASGDAIDFAAYHIGGGRYRDLESGRRDEVRDWFDPCSRTVAQPAPRLRKQELSVAWENADTAYPPTGEVEALWESCSRVDSDRNVADYLAFRNICDLSELVAHDCVRALPRGRLPEWASVYGIPWSESGHLVVVPLYDWHGELRSVLARSVERAPRLKTAAANGYQRRGLVMAGTIGRQMLVTGRDGYFHSHEPFRLTIHEGEIDMLRAVSLGADCDLDPRPGEYRAAGFRGVLGIFSGSFTPDIAYRVPSRSVVVLATDDDAQGDAYAAKIQELLGDRVTYERAPAPKD